MYKLNFLPFVGSEYSTGGIFGKRVMVLGESHYGKNPTLDFTRNVVREYLDPESEYEEWMNTYLKFERSLVNRYTTKKESETIWQSLLFYNYLQVLMDGPRISGTSQQYKDSARAFFEVLDRYNPELIIVWGARLWENLPWERWTEGDSLIIDNYEVDNGTYSLPNLCEATVVKVYHPSGGYSWSWWHKVVKYFLEMS